jgi:hypothetical protein
MVIDPPHNHPLPYDEDEITLIEVITDLIRTFSLGRVKAEVNRRPRLQEIGRPSLLNQLGLFSFWLIVKTSALRERGKIDPACQRIAQLGLVYQQHFHKPPISWYDPNKLRKLFYKAEVALNKYDIAHSESIAHVSFGSFKQRLQDAAEKLKEDILFFNLLPLVTEVVRYELVRDGVGFENPLNPRPEDPEFPGGYSDLVRAVICLKLRFGEDHVKVVLKHLPKRHLAGHPKYWYDTKLFALWLIIQNTSKILGVTIEQACSKIAKIGGIFASFDDECKIQMLLVSRGQRIRHLYYEAESSFRDFEAQHSTGNEALPLREQLRTVAGQLAETRAWILPVLSLAIPYVLERLNAQGICHCEVEMPERTGESIDISHVKFVPDGSGRWVVHPKGVFD